MIGFIIWSITCLILLGVAVSTWRAEKPTAFYSGTKPPKVKDARKYNHQVAVLWVVYAVLFELLGIPIMCMKQNSASFVFVIFGVVFLTMLLPVAYHFVLKRNQ